MNSTSVTTLLFFIANRAERIETPEMSDLDTFPHFGSEEYWENETRDLEEQLELILGGKVAGNAPADEGSAGKDSAEGQLTNKDFFWDL